MSNYNSLKATINANIKTNGNQEITGSVLNSVLTAMVNTLGGGYSYAGVASPTTNPGTPDFKVFYLAATAGSYTNFGGINLSRDEVAILKWDSSWHKETIGVASKGQIEELIQQSVVKNPGINIFDPNDRNVKIGYYLSGNTLHADSSYNTSGYIPVTPQTQYSDSLEMGSLRFVSFYDANFNYLSNVENTSTFTTPANCYYIRFSSYSSQWAYAQISIGDRTNYQPYSPIDGYLPDGYDEKLLELKGFGNFGPSAGVTQNGECFYNTDTHQIWQATNFASNRYRVIPYYPGSIYSYGGNFYIWNGSDLVKAPTDMSTLQQMVSDLSQAVAEFGSILADLENTIDPVLMNPLRGVSFGTGTPQDVVAAITKVWVQSVNPANVAKVIANAPKLYIRYISNATGANRPALLINDTLEGADTDAVISYALSSQSEPRSVKEIIRAKTLGTTNTAWGLGTDGANIYIEIDWSKISGTIRNLAIELDTANLQLTEVEKVSLSAVQSSIVQNSLYAQSVVCFGDSITELADTNGLCYSDYLRGFSNANIINVGIGGSMLRQRSTPVETPTSNSEAYAALDVVNMVEASIQQNFSKQVAAAEYLRDHASDDNTAIVARLQSIDWANVGIVTILAGTNDWYGGSNIGTTGTTDKSTTLGAINYIIRNLLTTYPHLKIFWFTPIVRWINYSGGTGTQENWGDNYVAGEYTLKQFAELIKSEVSAYNLPICDLYNTLGWNMYNFSNYFPDNDGTHPRKPSGMIGIGARFFGFIQANKNF